MLSYAAAVLILIYVRDVKASEDNAFQGFRIPCKDTTPRCIKESFETIFSEFVRGIPSLDIKPLDPLVADKINIEMPGGLNIEFYEGQTKGLKRCTINSASLTENKFNVVLYCNLTTKGKYRSTGKMLMFPIDGSGDAAIISKNLRIELTSVLDITETSGKKYLVLKEYDTRHSYQGQVFFKISNLFNGNPEISNLILEFMNRNWHAVAEEFGAPIINLGIQAVINNVEKLLRRVPMDRLLG